MGRADTISFRLAPGQGGLRRGSLSARLIMPAMNGPETSRHPTGLPRGSDRRKAIGPKRTPAASSANGAYATFGIRFESCHRDDAVHCEPPVSAKEFCGFGASAAISPMRLREAIYKTLGDRGFAPTYGLPDSPARKCRR